MLRRSLLLATPAVALGGCSLVSTSNGTTTVNVAQFNAYAQAAQAAVAAVLAVPVVTAAVGAPGVALIAAAVGTVTTAISAFDQATGGRVTFSLTDTTAVGKAKDVISAMTGLLTDLQGTAKALAGKIGSNDLANVNAVIDALQAAIAFVSAMLTGIGVARPKMTSAQVFMTVGLPVPAWVK